MQRKSKTNDKNETQVAWIQWQSAVSYCPEETKPGSITGDFNASRAGNNMNGSEGQAFLQSIVHV